MPSRDPLKIWPDGSTSPAGQAPDPATKAGAGPAPRHSDYHGLDVHPTSPCRAPDWRWRRAARILDDHLPPNRRRDDDGVAAALAFQSELRACVAEADHETLWARCPGACAALRIYEADPPLARWLLEARILAGGDLVTIAAGAGLEPEAVDFYRRNFFHVDDKREALDYLQVQVIGRAPRSDLPHPDWRWLWMSCALHGGPAVLEAVAAPMMVSRPGGPMDLAGYAKAVAPAALLARALLAVHQLPTDGRGALRTLRLLRRLTDSERRHARRIGESAPARESAKRESALRATFEQIHADLAAPPLPVPKPSGTADSADDESVPSSEGPAGKEPRAEGTAASDSGATPSAIERIEVTPVLHGGRPTGPSA